MISLFILTVYAYTLRFYIALFFLSFVISFAFLFLFFFYLVVMLNRNNNRLFLIKFI